jgi:hypothetical protein
VIHLYQPEESNLCGQTCVAMIAGVSVEEAVRIFGTKGKTRTKQVADALRSLGLECSDKLTRVPQQDDYKLPQTCIVKLKIDWHPKQHTHWTLWHKDRFYDPSEFLQFFLQFDGRYHKEHGLVPLSYLEIHNFTHTV